jgi:hypothetical protein
VTLDVEEQGRIGGSKKGLRIIGIGDGEDSIARDRQPLKRTPDIVGTVILNQPVSGIRADGRPQGGRRSCIDVLGKTKSRQQAALAVTAKARCQGQPQPVPQPGVDIALRSGLLDDVTRRNRP